MSNSRRRPLCLCLSLTNDMIYIHIPFCKRKCLYCDFYSICDFKKAKEYTDAVIEEIKSCEIKKTQTVYIGGGTPTAIGEELIRIVKAVREKFLFEENYEFTVEANPGAVSFELLKELFENGVNRISLGAQSFNDDELRALGRIHTAEEIFKTVDDIKRAGFTNFNVDLMLATPNQTMESLMHTLDCIEKIAPPHVSAYSLIVEENTPFYDMELSLPDENEEREMYYYTSSRLKTMGLSRYEISNFAQKGFESCHNTHYWQDFEYVGIGAGAHSYFGGERYSNSADVDEYIAGKGRKTDIVKISPLERSLELFMLGLRMTDGVLYNGEFPERVNPLLKKGLLEVRNDRLRLTKRGTDMANLVFMEFLND